MRELVLNDAKTRLYNIAFACYNCPYRDLNRSDFLGVPFCLKPKYKRCWADTKKGKITLKRLEVNGLSPEQVNTSK